MYEVIIIQCYGIVLVHRIPFGPVIRGVALESNETKRVVKSSGEVQPVIPSAFRTTLHLERSVRSLFNVSELYVDIDETAEWAFQLIHCAAIPVKNWSYTT